MCLAGSLWPGKVGAALGRVPPTACACGSLRPVLPFDRDEGWGGALAAPRGGQGKACDDRAGEAGLGAEMGDPVAVRGRRRALDREGRREEGCCKTQAFVFVQICIQTPSPTSSLP